MLMASGSRKLSPYLQASMISQKDVALINWNQRLPHKLLSSWIDSERPAGRPQHSWGRSMINDLPRFGLDITRDGWAASVAQDRIKWNWMRPASESGINILFSDGRSDGQETSALKSQSLYLTPLSHQQRRNHRDSHGQHAVHHS